MSRFEGKTDAELERLAKAAERARVLKDAEESLLPFMRLTMPDPDHPEDSSKSQYVDTPQARLLCECLERVERAVRAKKPDKNALKRVCISIGPQLGKSQITSRGFPAWFTGRNPAGHLMLGSYNQDFANEFGDEVRAITKSDAYKQVFPNHSFRKGSESKSYLVTTHGGKLAFVGVGGSGTGKPADMFVIDDPIRNDQDAQSPVYRETLWNWFNKVSFTRCHGKSGIVIVHTRWHEDDLIGRLVDPEHPEHDPTIAAKWLYINIPAVVTDPKLAQALGLVLNEPTDPEVVEQFGNKPMAALWEARKPLIFLSEARRLDPRGFDALYLGNPSPEDGSYFTKDMLVEYEPSELPERLRNYGASDHAVSEKQERDETVIGCFGVDEEDGIWIYPDVVWDRMETDRTVEELLVQMRIRKPLTWWLENELISKSFGPFLRKRMLETGTYTMVDGVTPSKDLRLRARAIQGRMAMRKVYFPKFAPWWQRARQQLLKFPHATHDDFVAFMALIGLGLMKEVSADREQPKGKVVKVGSIEWVKARARKEHRDREHHKLVAGF